MNNEAGVFGRQRIWGWLEELELFQLAFAYTATVDILIDNY